MKALSIITVLLDIFSWFLAIVGTLGKMHNNSPSAVSGSPSPSNTWAVIIFFAILLLLNVATLVYLLKKKQGVESQEQKGNLRRVFIGIAWFAIIYFVSCFIFGAILGALLGSSGISNDAMQAKIHIFFIKYGIILFLGSVLVAAVGSIKGWLPWTNKNQDQI